jgi:hypothetical protein
MSAAAVLWVWRNDPVPPPERIIGPRPLGWDRPGPEFEHELMVWTDEGHGWSWDMSTGGAWLGELGTRPPPPTRPESNEWSDIHTVGQLGPLWIGSDLVHLHDGLTVAAGLAPPEIGRLDLRSGDGVVTSAVPDPADHVFILATELRPVRPVAVGADGIDLLRADGRPLLGPDTFNCWDQFTEP